MTLQNLVPVLICFPFLMAILMLVIKNNKIRGRFCYVGSVVIMLLTLIIITVFNSSGLGEANLYVDTEIADKVILVGEFLLMALVIYKCIKYKRIWISFLSIIPTCMIAYLDLFAKPLEKEQPHIYIDKMALLMCIIVAVIGGLICIYAVGYMHGYHQHHKEFKDRRRYFFALLFTFLGAMFGLVLSSNLIWLDFFWEVTSICSFLLIGYTQTEEAIFNSFRQLWMNLLGGFGFAAAVFIGYFSNHTVLLSEIVSNNAVLPVAFLSFAALTKSAQLPFSQWLLGAMVAPTPSSALLHSATMVKAGVYLLVRLSPALNGTQTGSMVAFIGGFTFFAMSLLAISQSDGKKVLAYSTISNLGLITACCGIGKPETVWAAIFLIIFHAVSKSMLFQTVGAVENATGSRDIESMQSLIIRLPKLAFPMVVGIAGMFLAPFGMLIAKWAALKAFVDAKDILLIIFLVYGSATTMFYWTKWLCKILSRRSSDVKQPVDKTKPGEFISIYIHSALVVLLCALFPLLSKILVEPIVKNIDKISYQVLSDGNLYIMIVLLVSVFVLPSVMYIFAKHINTKKIESYMSGINTGNSTSFYDSFGESQNLKLSNWYMTDWFGEKKMMPISLIISTFALVMMLIMIIVGGVA